MASRGLDDSLPTSIYREPHKGLRYAMTGALTAAGNATAHPDSLAALAAQWADVSALFAMHHRQESCFLDPVIARHAPQHRARLAADNSAMVDATHRLDHAMSSLLAGPPEQQWCLLEQFYLDLATYVADTLIHFRFEDTEIMPSLRGALDARQLEMFRVELRNDITHVEMTLLIKLMMPALNFVERIDVLTDLQSDMSAADFEDYRCVAEEAVGPDQYRDLAQAIGLP